MQQLHIKKNVVVNLFELITSFIIILHLFLANKVQITVLQSTLFAIVTFRLSKMALCTSRLENEVITLLLKKYSLNATSNRYVILPIIYSKKLKEKKQNQHIKYALFNFDF